MISSHRYFLIHLHTHTHTHTHCASSACNGDDIVHTGDDDDEKGYLPFQFRRIMPAKFHRRMKDERMRVYSQKGQRHHGPTHLKVYD